MKVSENSLKNLIIVPQVVPGGTARKPVQVKIAKDQYPLWMSVPMETRNAYLRACIELYLIENGKIAKTK